MPSGPRWIAAIVTASLPALLAAEDPQRVGVLLAPLHEGLERSVAEVEPILEETVSSDSGASVVDLGWHARSDEKAILDVRAQEARAAYDSGLKAFDEFGYGSARSAFDRAIDLYEASDLSRHFNGLLDARAKRAAAAYFGGEPNEANNDLERLFTLNPAYVFDSGRRDPEFARLLDEARSRIQALPRTSLEILTDPVPARVWVNGTYRGVTPIEVGGLAPGHHHVTVLAPGYGFAQDRQLAEPGAVVRFRLVMASGGQTLTDIRDKARAALESGEIGEIGRDLAAWASLDEVLVAGLSENAGTLSLLTARIAADGHVTSSHRIQFESRGSRGNREKAARSALKSNVSELYAVSLPRGPNDSPVLQVPIEDPVLSRMDVVGWGSVGAGAAAGLTGVVLSVRGNRLRQEAMRIPQTHVAEYEAVMRSRRGVLLGAGASYALAAGGIGLGIWLLLDGPVTASSRSPDRLSVTPLAFSEGAGLAVSFELP